MKQRCTNPKSKDFKYYGAKGVCVCAEWEDFETFFYWAMSHGYKDGLTIERINGTVQKESRSVRNGTM